MNNYERKISNIVNIQSKLHTCEIAIEGLANIIQENADKDNMDSLINSTKDMRIVNVLSLLRIASEIILDELKDQKDAMARLEKMIAEVINE